MYYLIFRALCCFS